MLDLINQNGCYPYEYMNGFEKSKEQFPSKTNFYSFFIDWEKYQ